MSLERPDSAPPRGDVTAEPTRRLRVALISPKGPLYRHRGGIFGQSLRYMPLTLPTLAALVPDELDIELTCLDEGIQDVDTDLDVDLVGMTVITGTAPRAYALAAAFRARGVAVVLGGPHVTLAPEDAAPHADAIVVGYAERSWPRLLSDVAAGRLAPRYDQAPDLDLAESPLPDRSVLPRWRYLTPHVFEATRGCLHTCDFCVVPSAWGRRPLQKPPEAIVEDLKRMRTRKAIFVDLNLIADRHYARRLFTALRPLANLAAPWIGTPRLPRAGRVLASASVVSLAHQPGQEPAAVALLRHAAFHASRLGLDLLLVGGLARDGLAPWLDRALPARRYRTRLYVVAWTPEAGAWAEALREAARHDGLQVELSAL